VVLIANESILLVVGSLLFEVYTMKIGLGGVERKYLRGRRETYMGLGFGNCDLDY
jgi:hypothetical protein